jgi:hypothetical protein
MRSIRQFVRTKFTFLASITLATFVGGIMSAAVLAAIPDNSGVIHGCYKNNSGSLKVIDSTATNCGSGETAVNWNQTGAAGTGDTQSAYAAFNSDGSALDTSFSRSINSSKIVQNNPNNPDAGYSACLNVTFVPKTGIVNPSSAIITANDLDGPMNIDNLCGPGYNVLVFNISPESAPIGFSRIRISLFN